LVGVAVDGIRARDDLEQELERARAALERQDDWSTMPPTMDNDAATGSAA
jgi:hypothetical protein